MPLQQPAHGEHTRNSAPTLESHKRPDPLVEGGARVDGEDIPLMDMEPKTGLFSKFKGMVGMSGRAYSHA